MQPREIVAAVMGWKLERERAEAVEPIMRRRQVHLGARRLS